MLNKTKFTHCNIVGHYVTIQFIIAQFCHKFCRLWHKIDETERSQGAGDGEHLNVIQFAKWKLFIDYIGADTICRSRVIKGLLVDLF